MYIPKIIPRNRTGLFYKHKENNYMQGGLGGGLLPVSVYSGRFYLKIGQFARPSCLDIKYFVTISMLRFSQRN